MSPKRYDVKLSFGDVFKSSKVLRQEMAALAYKKQLLEEENKRYSDLEALVPENLPATTAPHEATAQPPPASNDKAPASEPAKEAEPAKKENDVSEWTADQDAELLKLKSENTSWRAISTAIGKPVGELKNRWNLIRPATTPNPPKEAASKKNEEGKQPEPQEGSRPKVKRRVSFTEPLFGASKAEDSSGRASARKATYYPGDKFTLEEIIMLNKLAERYEEEKWLRISSRFYDKTGSRISPEEAKQYVLTNSG